MIDYLFNGIILDETLYSTLSLIGANLKSLWIEWNCGLTGIKLNRILTACQNLTSVRCITNDITDWTVSHITTLRLIHLEPATRINSVDRLKSLLQHSPDLRHLELRCVHTLSILPTIHKYYPHTQLITLISNKAHFQRQFGPVRIPPMDMVQQEGKLQCLMLSAMGSTEKILPSILENSRNTLQTLCLDIGVYHPRRNHEEIMLPTTWELPLFVSSTPIPLLTYLHISDSSWRERTISFFRDHLPNTLRCCPALTTLVLERFSQTREDYIIEDNIYTIIQQLTKLSCLRLINFSVNGPHFKRLLQHYAQIQTTTSTNNTYHPLRQLAILNNDSVTPVKSNVLWYVVRITSLEQLQLRCPHMDVTDADMADFTYFIRRLMTRLIHLELDSMPIHESAAENLAQCDNLWTLTIQGNNVQEMTNEDIQVLEASGKVVIRRTNNS
ncbi:hypothetical protein INT45_012467 [Circinella minor]|uniref:F-box domain-containing protein n=1 Tax=Circinella minor TaxID=1195481 RepID=A0A8H7S3G8_9FUNG|nr:hypothetical protein INT45_012467 [Circinella minor]